MEILFWGLAALVFIVIFGYGGAIVALAAVLPKKPPVAPPESLRATLLIAAHNEEACIADKLRDALSQEVGPHRLSVCVVSDGSTDRTVGRVSEIGDPRISVIDIPQHVGKATALNTALATIDADVVVFSDANSRLAPGALAALLRHFGRPEVGGVCGTLAIARERSGWLGWAENLYWRYDSALKQAESRLGGVVSAQGTLYAVRRHLIGTVPLSVADDFFISTEVVARGHALAFEPTALAIEEVSNDTRREFGRRVRSTERGWRGLLMRRALLNPARTGFYAVHLLFHKVLRRMMPVPLGLLFLVSAALATEAVVYALAFAAQAAFLCLAAAPMLVPAARRLPGSSMAFFFIETQVAMALGLTRVALGRHSTRWNPVRSA
jgi:cellulose synthase/poly-beta-1,6-N-acetylglucosamine synthase-like glycosyltransferase